MITLKPVHAHQRLISAICRERRQLDFRIIVDGAMRLTFCGDQQPIRAPESPLSNPARSA
ncbi:hypothetical protein VE26_14445 [Devosia chinhatensis]|uniref:Uncharacterized protein n=2 Tax=Devosia chinhatensis TaxID=429727 RepID=A0A0F5FG10_9HYPH|nr:hypothetical protein VE26_14445 [Devosia chinhatensis]